MTIVDVATAPLGGVVLNAGAAFVGGLVGALTFRRKQVREVADGSAREAVDRHVATFHAPPASLIVRPFGGA